MKAEELRCFEFKNGEQEWVIARNKEEAYEYYKSLIGDEIEECDIQEVKEWHNLIVREETAEGYKDMTFLECAKEGYNEDTFEPYILASTCY